jgi:hypothetical protein
MQSFYNLVIEHGDGKKNAGDGPSARHDYEIGYERPTARLLAILSTSTSVLFNDLLQEIITAQAIDVVAAYVKRRIVGFLNVDIPDLQRIDKLKEDSSNELKVNIAVLTWEGRIHIPNYDLHCNSVKRRRHDNQHSGHFRAFITSE